MSEFVLIEYEGTTSTRTTVYYTPLTVMKRRATVALKDRLDKVVIIQSDDLNVFTFTRLRGDTKWGSVRSSPMDQW